VFNKGCNEGIEPNGVEKQEEKEELEMENRDTETRQENNEYL
jgi:hypothetical protein